MRNSLLVVIDDILAKVTKRSICFCINLIFFTQSVLADFQFLRLKQSDNKSSTDVKSQHDVLVYLSPLADLRYLNEFSCFVSCNLLNISGWTVFR